MSWRPKEGWKNPHTPMQDEPFIDLADAHFRNIADGKHTAYEAGADAMLKALWPLFEGVRELCLPERAPEDIIREQQERELEDE